jgi:integrase/recombinase XerD
MSNLIKQSGGEALVKKSNISVLNQQHIAVFLQDTDLSLKTKSDYKRILINFAEFTQEYPNWMTTPGIRRYKQLLIEKGLTKNSASTYLAAIRAFFSWMAEKGIIEINPAKNVKGFKKPKNWQRDPLVKEQAIRVFEIIKESEGKQKERNLAICYLAYKTGIREIEMHRANINDLRPYGSEIVLWVQGKGRDEKDQFVLIRSEVYDVLMDYFQTRSGRKQDDPLFIGDSNRSKGRLSTRSIRRVLTKYMILASVKTATITGHSFRHGFATTALENNATLPQVQAALRHVSIDTTMKYVHLRDRIENGAENYVDV